MVSRVPVEIPSELKVSLGMRRNSPLIAQPAVHECTASCKAAPGLIRRRCPAALLLAGARFRRAAERAARAGSGRSPAGV